MYNASTKLEGDRLFGGDLNFEQILITFVPTFLFTPETGPWTNKLYRHQSNMSSSKKIDL